jgi:thiol-disulfide isomerase/thioredoxin
MRRTFSRSAYLTAAVGGYLIIAMPVLSAERSADQILKEIDAVKLPKLDSTKKDDRSAVLNHKIKLREAIDKRARLIARLYKIAPDHKRIPALMEERWKSIGMHPEKGRYDELVRELENVIARTKDKKLRIEASYTRAQLKLNPVSSRRSPDPSGVDGFLNLAPQDPRAAGLLASAVAATHDDKKKAALLERLRTGFPGNDYVGMLEGPHDKSESLGKPFHLVFDDAITGSSVSMTGLRGKVVVIDFWATWCGPCVGEMPHMKELYAKYRDKGVEFIGVSLDQSQQEGGLEKLKTFVKDKGIEWPQYFQGKGWKSEFSSSWGINSIPCVFVVDAEGKLHSTEARGKLEQLIPALLKKRNASTAAAGAGGG